MPRQTVKFRWQNHRTAAGAVSVSKAFTPAPFLGGTRSRRLPPELAAGTLRARTESGVGGPEAETSPPRERPGEAHNGPAAPGGLGTPRPGAHPRPRRSPPLPGRPTLGVEVEEPGIEACALRSGAYPLQLTQWERSRCPPTGAPADPKEFTYGSGNWARRTVALAIDRQRGDGPGEVPGQLQGVTVTAKASVAAGCRQSVPANAGLFGDPAEPSQRGGSGHDSPRREKRRR